MDKTNIENGRAYRTAGLITGLLIMLIAGFYDVKTSFLLFPVFAFFIFLYVYKATRKNNILFLCFLVVTMISEILFLYDFNSYVSASSLLSATACVLLLFLLKPVLKKESFAFSKHNMLELIVGFIGLGFVMAYLVYMVVPLVPNAGIFIVSVIIFAVAIAVFFITPSLNKHTDNVSLLGIGGAYLTEMAFAFIYKYLFTEIGFLIISIFMGIFIKVVLAIYLTKIDRIVDYDGTGTSV